MYLEISGRRTGKTTRLIQAAEKAGKNALIIAFNSAARVLYDGLPCVSYEFFSSPQFKPEDYGGLYFFDEFALMKDIPIYEDAYYVGTPDVVATNDLERLLEANGYEYHVFAAKKKSYTMSDKFKESLSADLYATEALGCVTR